MYFTILIDNFHGNKMGFISSSMEEVKAHLIKHLKNWDVDYTEDELANILANGDGFANEASKTYIEVSIAKVQPGKAIDLR